MPDDPTLVSSATPPSRQERRLQLQRLRKKLEVERVAWCRWLPRLKRTFGAVMKIDQRIRRLERQIDGLSKS